MRRALLILAVLALGGLVAWAWWPRPIAVEAATIGPQTITVTVDEDGVAEIREVHVVSAPIAGRLERVGLHAGDAVIGGETTVAVIGPAAAPLLDARSRAVAEAGLAAAEAAVDLARAQLMQAEAALAFREAEAARSVALFERAAISQHLLDLALLERDTAASALDSARAGLAVRERERDSAAAVLAGDGGAGESVTLTAPVTGRVLHVLTEDDQTVAPGTPIIAVGDPADLMVRVDLLSRDAVRVAPGAAAVVTGWGGPDLPAAVERVEPAATTRVSALGISEQRVEVWLRLTGAPADWALLGHDYRVTARIRLWTGEDVTAIPVAALFRAGSDWAAYVIRDGRAALQRITLGERDDRFAQVLDGLAAGETVILHPSDLIGEGTAVRVID